MDRLIKSPASQRGRDFAIILRCLADNGYYVEWRVINAADYGLPQKRRRLFIFASRTNQRFIKEVSKHSFEDIVSKHGFFAQSFAIKPIQTPESFVEIDISKKMFPELTDVSDKFSTKFHNCGVMYKHRVYTHDCDSDYNGKFMTLRNVLEPEVDSKYYIQDDAIADWEYLKGSKSIPRTAPDGKTYLYIEGKIPFPDNLNIAGRTMLTSEGTLNRSSHIILDPSTNRYRKLTPRECEGLNGFPKDWTANVMTERQRYFCMGNALVVPIITRMGQTLKKIEEEASDD